MSPATHDDLARVQAEIAAAQEELAALRCRRAQEQEEMTQAAQAAAFTLLLPFVDDLDRALAHQPAALASDPWVQGVAIIGAGLHSLLDRQGLVAMNPLGQPFDPRQHEAVAHLPTDDVAPDTVTAVYREGYVLGGRVLRPAQVQVAVEARS